MRLYILFWLMVSDQNEVIEILLRNVINIQCKKNAYTVFYRKMCWQPDCQNSYSVLKSTVIFFKFSESRVVIGCVMYVTEIILFLLHLLLKFVFTVSWLNSISQHRILKNTT